MRRRAAPAWATRSWSGGGRIYASFAGLRSASRRPAGAGSAGGSANIAKSAAKHLQDAPASCKKPRASARRAPVAQLDRALPSEGRGQGFESLRVRHINQ